MDKTKPTAFVLGRFQPPHGGHVALVKEAKKRVNQVCIAIREQTIDDKNPYTFEEVKRFWEIKLIEAGFDLNDIIIILLPNITNIFYGRDVGYSIEQIELPPEIQAISATKIRAELELEKTK